MYADRAAAGAVMRIMEELLSKLNTDAGISDIRQGLLPAAVLNRNRGLVRNLPLDYLQPEQPREGPRMTDAEVHLSSPGTYIEHLGFSQLVHGVTDRTTRTRQV